MPMTLAHGPFSVVALKSNSACREGAKALHYRWRRFVEYVFRNELSFEEIEHQTIDALERGGFVVQRTFSLRSATGVAGTRSGGEPGYSVLMLYAPGADRQALGSITLHEQARRLVLEVLPASPTADLEALLVAALSLAGLDFCVHAVGAEACIEPEGKSGKSLERRA
jgi:hypothetical protein